MTVESLVAVRFLLPLANILDIYLSSSDPGCCRNVQAALDEVSPYLTTSMNLGHADVYPATSGKAHAAQFLMRRLGAQPAHCRLLMDDHNDIALAGP